MSSLGLCTNPECTSKVKWDREARPECPVCGVTYQPQMNKPGEVQPKVQVAPEPETKAPTEPPAEPEANGEPKPCPTCQAVGDARCRRPNGHVAPKNHQERAA